MSADSSSGFVPPASAPTTPAAIAAEYANRPDALKPMSLAEFQYGVSPTLGSDVTYQPDVIVMEHGADAIHGYSSDGLTWLLDASAPHVSELQPGKIMFATGRAVGRILAVTLHGTDVAVTLGPAALTGGRVRPPDVVRATGRPELGNHVLGAERADGR